jgi:lysozyme family protein
MARFEDAIDVILVHEGGYVDNPHDHGGASNWGISLRYLLATGGLKAHPELDLNHDGLIDFRDMRLIPKDMAIAIYERDWWAPHQYGSINDQQVATKLFDMAVNMGAARAGKLAQSALVACGKPVSVDGVLGAKSFTAINSLDPANFLHVLRQKQADFYRAIVAHDPTQAQFLKGWLRRAEF